VSGHIVFLDTETTGLGPDHEVWEIAFVEHKLGDEYDTAVEFQIWPDLRYADPTGLRISRFYERNQLFDENGNLRRGVMRFAEFAGTKIREQQEWTPIDPAKIAHIVASRLAGAHVIGAVPNFDDRMLDKFLRQHGEAPSWHYHLVDIESMALGYLAANGMRIDPPYNSDELADLIGVPALEDGERHTALGDALWVRAWWGTMRKDALRQPSQTAAGPFLEARVS
jgi:hypothetical protein